MARDAPRFAKGGGRPLLAVYTSRLKQCHCKSINGRCVTVLLDVLFGVLHVQVTTSSPPVRCSPCTLSWATPLLWFLERCDQREDMCDRKIDGFTPEPLQQSQTEHGWRSNEAEAKPMAGSPW
jgi:hypothetical protein